MNIAKALVVDDSKLACVTLSRMLEKRAIRADCVGSGEEALEYLKKTRPDIIFLDVIMQGMDGYQTARAITNNTETSTIPVFVCSSNDTAEDRERARQNGATGFLTKPPNQTQLDDNLSALREKIAAPASGAHTLAPPAAAGEPSSAAIARIAADTAERVARTAAEQSAQLVAHTVAERAVQAAFASLTETVHTTADQVARQVALEATTAAADQARNAAQTEAQRVSREITAELVPPAAREAATELVDGLAASLVGQASAAARREAERVTREVADAVVPATAQAAVAEAATAATAQAAAATVEPLVRAAVSEHAAVMARQSVGEAVHVAVPELLADLRTELQQGLDMELRERLQPALTALLDEDEFRHLLLARVQEAATTAVQQSVAVAQQRLIEETAGAARKSAEQEVQRRMETLLSERGDAPAPRDLQALTTRVKRLQAATLVLGGAVVAMLVYLIAGALT